MLRQEVLKVYKQIIKSVSRIDDDYYKTDMKIWARNDFKANKNMKDEVSIRKYHFISNFFFNFNFSYLRLI